MPRTKLQNQLEFPKVPEFVRPDLYGVTWGLSEVSKMVKRDTKFVSKYVLKPNRRVLDVKYGGPVKFPTASNDEKSNAPYKIQAREIAFWIDQNWSKIQGKGWD